MTEPFLRSRHRGPDDKVADYPPLPVPLVVPVYDNHTHLEFADGENPLDWREQLDRASSVGVRGVVQVGTDLETSRWSADVASVEPRVLAAVALHPNEAPELAAAGKLEEHLAGIAELAAQPRVRAIGETGLDFFRTGEEGRDAQIASFEAHIAIAKEHGLALQIHDRDAHREVLEVLARDGAPEVTVFHCFSADAEIAAECVARGYLLSFAGPVTFASAEDVRAAARVVPAEQLLVETDAPYLTPAPHRGAPNAPYLLPLTVRRLAEVRGDDLAGLCARLHANATRVYGPW